MAIMNKTLILHKLNNVDFMPELERWFVKYHCQEVLAQEPWLSRYVMFRVLPPAEGMRDFGFLWPRSPSLGSWFSSKTTVAIFQT